MIRAFDSANQRLDDDEIGKLPTFRDTDFRVHPIAGLVSKASINLTNTSELTWSIDWESKGKLELHYIPQSLDDLAKSWLGAKEAGVEWPLPVVAYYGAARGYIEVPERLQESKVNYDFPTSAFVGALNPNTDFKETMKWFDQEEAAELRRQRQDAEFASKSLEAVRESIADLLGGRYTAPYFDERHKFVIQPQGSHKLLLVSQLSQGYQAMLALSIDFARRLALATPSAKSPWANSRDDYIYEGSTRLPAIMIIDEIDLHLHPRWQQKVLGDLMRAFPNTQFVVTTHSPQILSTVDKKHIRVIHQDAEGKWRADPPTDQAQGVASSYALSHIMGVDPVPDVKPARWLREYIVLIENGQSESPEALKLRNLLIATYGEQHQVILDADRLMRFQNFKLRKANAS